MKSPMNMSNQKSKFAQFCLLLLMASATGGCAVLAVGSAAVSVASTGVKAVTTVGGLAVDGASAAVRAGKSDPDSGKKQD